MRIILGFAVVSAFAMLLPARAEAAWVECPGTAATTDREFKINVTGATCYKYGTGNINADGTDALNNDPLGWITIDKDPGSEGTSDAALSVTGVDSTQGTFTINPLVWAAGYTRLLIAFKSGSAGALNPDWAAFELPYNTQGTFNFKISSQGMSHANLYGIKNGTLPPPAVPEPATLALFGTGLGLSGWMARRRSLSKAVRD